MILSRAWKFVRGPGASRIAGRESDVNEILRGDKVAEPAGAGRAGAMPEEALALTRRVLGAASFSEAVEAVRQNEEAVLRYLESADIGNEDLKADLLKVVDSLRTADPAFNSQAGRALFAAADSFYDPSKGSSIDFAKMKEFTLFPEFIDRAEQVYKRSHAEVPGLAQSFQLPVDNYFETEFNRWKDFCSDVVAVSDEIKVYQSQLDEFEKVLPTLRLDDLMKANPELAAKLENEVEQSRWFVDEDAVEYDDEAAKAEHASRKEAMERWAAQLNAEGQQVYDRVFSGDNNSSSLTHYSFIDVLNTTGGDWKASK